MPDGLPEAAYQMIHGRFTDDQRKGVFKPEIPVVPDVCAEDKLLAYTGRDPGLLKRYGASAATSSRIGGNLRPSARRLRLVVLAPRRPRVSKPPVTMW